MTETELSVAFVSTWPGRDSERKGGVAAYTRSLLRLLAGVARFTVVADQNADTQEFSATIIPSWRLKSATLFRAIDAAIERLNPSIVHVQHELFLYGSALSAVVFPLWFARLSKRKRAVITVHGVIDDRDVDARLIGTRAHPALVPFIRWVVRYIFRSIARSRSLKVVHESVLRERLVRYGARPDDVHVIPLTFNAAASDLPSREDARRRLGFASNDRVIFSWGFFNTYKGFDLLLDAFRSFAQKNPNAHLVLGVGAHPKLGAQPEYRQQFEDFKSRVESVERTRFEGFLAEEDLPVYAAAADVSVFPYTEYLAASGPLSFAVGYETPVLLSSVFRDVPPEITFSPNAMALETRLHEFFNGHGDKRNYVKALSDAIRPEKIRQAYEELYREALQR